MNTNEFTTRGRMSWALFVFSILFLLPVLRASIHYPNNVEIQHVAMCSIPLFCFFLQVLYAKTTILSVNPKEIMFNTVFKKRRIPLQRMMYIKYDLVITHDSERSSANEYFLFYDEKRREIFKLNLKFFSKKEKRTLFLNAIKKNKKDIVLDETCEKTLQGIHTGIPTILKEFYISLGVSEETADRLKNLHLIAGISLSVFFLWIFFSPLIQAFLS